MCEWIASCGLSTPECNKNCFYWGRWINVDKMIIYDNVLLVFHRVTAGWVKHLLEDYRGTTDNRHLGPFLKWTLPTPAPSQSVTLFVRSQLNKAHLMKVQSISKLWEDQVASILADSSCSFLQQFHFSRVRWLRSSRAEKCMRCH